MRAIIIGCALLAASFGASAQVNEKFADMSKEIEMVRSMAQTERKAVLVEAMPLTAEEGAAFWPLYDQYRADVRKANDKLVKVITDYAAAYETLTDEQGKKLTEEYLGFRGDLLKVRRNYLGKFSKVLPGKKLARFYQLENKLDALSDLSVASQIPLVR